MQEGVEVIKYSYKYGYEFPYFPYFLLLHKVSPYPVILSLENHCGQEQQLVMAQYLISILGEKLLKLCLDLPTSGELPSPNVRTLITINMFC